MGMTIPLWIAGIAVAIIGISQVYLGKWWGWLVIAGGVGLVVLGFYLGGLFPT